MTGRIELNEKIKSFGFENLDFNGNLGHTIEKDRNHRIYFEKDNDKKLTENMLFTFEPHIRMIGKNMGLSLKIFIILKMVLLGNCS